MADTAIKAETAPKVEHLRGCPAPPERIEAYPVTLRSGAVATMARCVQCGGQTLQNESEG